MTVSISITLDDDLGDELNTAVGGGNRSTVVAEAIREYLDRRAIVAAAEWHASLTSAIQSMIPNNHDHGSELHECLPRPPDGPHQMGEDRERPLCSSEGVAAPRSDGSRLTGDDAATLAEFNVI